MKLSSGVRTDPLRAKEREPMPKVILVNPSMTTFGYSFFTPRWLFVIAQATPADVVGDPLVVDESIRPFDSSVVDPGDIVGIGISSGNCTAGYRVLREAKLRGATVIVGGVSRHYLSG
jgi:hypothetical protein